MIWSSGGFFVGDVGPSGFNVRQRVE